VVCFVEDFYCEASHLPGLVEGTLDQRELALRGSSVTFPIEWRRARCHSYWPCSGYTSFGFPDSGGGSVPSPALGPGNTSDEQSSSGHRDWVDGSGELRLA